MKALHCLLAATMLATALAKEPTPVDKSSYNLFNPTPAQYLRDMDTDGPGATESPYTVDAGHFQIELTFLAYASDKGRFEGQTYELDAWAFAPMILKVGLLNRLDAQLLLQPYQVIEERIGNQRATSRGFGDMTLRLKYNFWGNDGGRTAFGAIPYVKFPTSADAVGNNSIEGGLVLPLSINLPDDFWLGLTTRFDAMRDQGGEDGYHAEVANSISFGANVFTDVFGYMEFFTLVSTERDARWVGTFNTGFIYSMTANLQLNVGVNLGVTRSADDWNPFVGMAWRY